MSYDGYFGELWIVSDSRSSLQRLSVWSSANDETSVFILLKLKNISHTHGVHLQWIPSYVNISGIEVADGLDKEIVRMKCVLWLFAYLSKTILK
ncbi:hypothetical protein TNIN_265861 [Trichonephila inaurata madagascariensis]|uniref:Uncharacterized protein n=1 Tax=Trichonephila inaurata madagascariensis TaxID=2747483 RepID=A0A8X7BS79_9ARAC|nr:hypothetical protein TNIN_265861 [Trichonephila inaurata madagascariensis]